MIPLWFIVIVSIAILVFLVYIMEPPSATIVMGDATPDLTSMIPITLLGISDGGYNTSGVTIDDGSVPLPTTSFFFFGTDYGLAKTIYWNSNNALLFGTCDNNNVTMDLSGSTCPAVLLGNYDRVLFGLSYKKTITTSCEILTILPTYTNYYSDNPLVPYQMVIRLIKEKYNKRRQWIEVTPISSPPSPGYSNQACVSYPSGTNVLGQPVNSNGERIDPTKQSPFNITDGEAFLNPVESMFSTASPPAGTTLLFQSDATGTTWNVAIHSHIL